LSFSHSLEKLPEIERTKKTTETKNLTNLKSRIKMITKINERINKANFNEPCPVSIKKFVKLDEKKEKNYQSFAFNKRDLNKLQEKLTPA